MKHSLNDGLLVKMSRFGGNGQEAVPHLDEETDDQRGQVAAFGTELEAEKHGGGI